MGKGKVENLVPFDRLTEEEQRRLASKGGKASVEARRKKKAMRELAQEILAMPLKEGDIEDVAHLADVKGKNLTIGHAAMLMQAQKAIKGDASALTFLRDTAGEKPVEHIDVSGDITAAADEIQKMIQAAKADGE